MKDVFCPTYADMHTGGHKEVPSNFEKVVNMQTVSQ